MEGVVGDWHGRCNAPVTGGRAPQRESEDVDRIDRMILRIPLIPSNTPLGSLCSVW